MRTGITGIPGMNCPIWRAKSADTAMPFGPAQKWRNAVARSVRYRRHHRVANETSPIILEMRPLGKMMVVGKRHIIRHGEPLDWRGDVSLQSDRVNNIHAAGLKCSECMQRRVEPRRKIETLLGEIRSAL